jgi:hypothetical protein
MKGLLLLALVAGLGLAATASAHQFVASPSLSIHKASAGGTRVIVFGKVRGGGHPICKKNRRIRLFQARPGADRLLATDQTNAQGEYAFPLHPRRHMKVYTRVGRLHKVSFEHDHLCRAATSRKVRLT